MRPASLNFDWPPGSSPFIEARSLSESLISVSSPRGFILKAISAPTSILKRGPAGLLASFASFESKAILPLGIVIDVLIRSIVWVKDATPWGSISLTVQVRSIVRVRVWLASWLFAGSLTLLTVVWSDS